MKNRAKRTLTAIAAVIMLLSLALSALVIPAFADENSGRQDVSAELTIAKGGATSIATMTFDDGLVLTAKKLNELCEKYGLTASLVVSGRNYVTYDTDRLTYTYVDSKGEVKTAYYYIGEPNGITDKATELKEILSAGKLDIVSHSRNHISVNSATLDDLDAQFGDTMSRADLIKNELQGSLADLVYAFGEEGYTPLAYAMPNSTHASDAWADLYNTFYAARNGNCVLYHSQYRGKMQSTDPATGNAVGSWYNPYGVRLMQVKDAYAPTNSVENIIAYLDTCVENNGWFISVAHGIVPTENYDISVEELEMIMAKMQTYQNAGKLWVANYTEATKYVRERQASEASAYTLDGKYYVNVTMADKTVGDNLPLPREVFNYPLTVKMEVPAGWVRAGYTLNGKAMTAECFTEGDKSYAYIDVVPNSGDVEVTDGTPPEERLDYVPGTYDQEKCAPNSMTAAKIAGDTGYNVTFATWASEESFKKGDAPKKWYTADAAAEGTEYYAANIAYATHVTGDIGYIHLFDNVTAPEAFGLPDNKELVINLGGNTFETSKTLTIGASSNRIYATSLVIKNGTFIQKGKFTARPGTTFRVINTIYDCQHNHAGSSVAALFEYINCEITYKSSTYYEWSIYPDVETEIRYVRSSITRPSSSIALFTLFTPHKADAENSLLISFDKYCKINLIQASGKPWMELSSCYDPAQSVTSADQIVYPEFLKTQYITFEEGCEVSRSVLDWLYTYNYKYLNKNVSGCPTPEKAYEALYEGSGYQAPKAGHKTSLGALDTELSISFVDKNGNVIDNDVKYVPGEGNMYKATRLDGYTMAILNEGSRFVDKAWTGTSISAADANNAAKITVFDTETGLPTAIKYAFIKNSETGEYDLVTDFTGYDVVAYRDSSCLVADFVCLDGVVFEKTILVKNDGKPDDGYLGDGAYVVLYGDAEFGNFNTYQGYDLTIDLNGHTFYNAKQTTNVQLGYDRSGYYEVRYISFINTSEDEATLDLRKKSGTYLQARPGSIVLFENINILFLDGTMFNEGGAQSITFRNCYVQATNASKPVSGVTQYTRLFDPGLNSKIYTEFIAKDENNYREYVIDNTVLEKTGITSLNHSGQSCPDRVKITVKNGSVLDIKAVGLNNQIAVSNTAIEKLVVDISTDTKYTSKRTAGGSIVTMNIPDGGMQTEVVETYYTPNGDKVAKEDLMEALKGSYYVLVGKNEKLTYGFKIADAEGAEILYLADYDEDGNAIITLADIKSIPEGGTITFLTDLKYDPAGNTDNIQRITGYANDITVDLNNRTFTLNYRWQLYDKATKFLFKNGNIVTEKFIYSNTGGTFFGNAGAYSEFTFENVNFSTAQNNLFQIYAGAVVIRGGSINAPGIVPINLNTSNSHSVTLDGVTIDAAYAISTTYMTGSVGMKDVYNVNNCIINVTDAAFRVMNNKIEIPADDFVKINVSNSYISGNLAYSDNSIKQQFLTVQLSETYLDRAPAVDSLYGTLTYGTGNMLMGVEDPEKAGYTYLATEARPAVGDNLQVNLTLMTNFDLNFYANPEVVLGVYYDGALLEYKAGATEYTYTSSFAAHEAADLREYEVWVKSGDVTYKLPLSYSILKYAEGLIASNYSDDSKALAKAAIAYVKEAYKVANAKVADYQLPEALRNFNSDVTPATAEGTLPEALTAAVASVQFKLESSVNLVIKIAGDYAGGTIKVNGVSYEAAAGSTVIVPLRAKALADTITVTAGAESGSFTLAGYVNSEEVQTSDMANLVQALYTYASYAKAYAESDAGKELK